MPAQARRALGVDGTAAQLHAQAIVLEPAELRMMQSAFEFELNEQGRGTVPIDAREALGIDGLDEIRLQLYVTLLDDFLD
jgi:hypothetical protein